MAQVHNRITGPQGVYLFFLRATGWMGLIAVPLFAFAWAAQALRPEIPILVALLASAPGVLAGFILAGVSAPPTFLLRPTSFLKGLLVSMVLGLLNGAVAVQVIMLGVAVDIAVLPKAAFNGVFDMIGAIGPDILTLAQLEAKADAAGMPTEIAVSILLATIAAWIVTSPVSLASWMALFLRFARPGPLRHDREKPEGRQQFAEAAQREKADALRAMRLRRARQRQTAV